VVPRAGGRRRHAGLRAEVADRGDGDDPALVGAAQFFVDSGHALAAAEVEAHVDHVGAVGDGEVDALGDLVGAAAAVAVQHPDRHQLGAVGEAGQADPVVRLLGDRAGDVGAVPVLVQRHRVVGDEVIALGELAGAEVGAAVEVGGLAAVGDPGVEDRDRDSTGAAAVGGDQVLPGGDRVDAAGRGRQQRGRRPRRGEEVPLQRGPAAGRAGVGADRARVVGDPRGRQRHLPGGGGEVVGSGVFDARAAAQRGGGPAHPDPAGQAHGASVPLPAELDDDPPRGEFARRRDADRRAGRAGGAGCG
jgi:hypothetical protein